MEASLPQGSTVIFPVLLYKAKKKEEKKRKFKYRRRRITHPLFIQFEELLGDFGCAERQSQKRDVELGDNLLQHLLERQTPHRAMPPCRRHSIL